MKKIIIILLTSNALLFYSCNRNSLLSTEPEWTPLPQHKPVARDNTDTNVFSLYSDTYLTGVYLAAIGFDFNYGPWTEWSPGNPHPDAAAIDEVKSGQAPEGDHFLLVTDGPLTNYLGWGFYTVPANQTYDITAFSSGNFIFEVKHTNSENPKLTLDFGGTDNDVFFVANGAPADNQWHTVSVAVSSFTGDLSQAGGINCMSDPDNADIEISLDNIRYKK